jgi:hypothetical protein
MQLKRSPGKQFLTPESRRSGYVSIVSLPKPSGSLPPVLLAVKIRFPSDWLWDACNDALSTPDDYFYGPSLKLTERANRLAEALPGARNKSPLGWYPSRPTSPLPSSLSVDALRAVLDHAPSTHYDSPPDEGMDCDEDGFTGTISYEWGVRYLDSLFAALIEVINQHGLGDDGWKNIRWDVYDKVRALRYGGNPTKS